MGCDFKAMGESKEEAVQNLMDHVVKTHPEMAKDKTPEQMDAWKMSAMSKTHEEM